MLVYVTHNGVEHEVRVEKRRNRLFVTLDDQPEERVDIIFVGNECSFIRNDGRVFQANVTGKKSDYTVWTSEELLEFGVETEYKRVVGKMRGQDLDSENQVKAKMPGKIVKVHAKEGDSVSKGDPLMVMEAMKMENEIKSPMDGKVTKVAVKTGDTVDSGELLLELGID